MVFQVLINVLAVVGIATPSKVLHPINFGLLFLGFKPSSMTLNYHITFNFVSRHIVCLHMRI